MVLLLCGHLVSVESDAGWAGCYLSSGGRPKQGQRNNFELWALTDELCGPANTSKALPFPDGSSVPLPGATMLPSWSRRRDICLGFSHHESLLASPRKPVFALR